MISLTIGELDQLTKREAKMLRAIADIIDTPNALAGQTHVTVSHGDGTGSVFTQEYLDGMAAARSRAGVFTGPIKAGNVVGGGALPNKIMSGSLDHVSISGIVASPTEYKANTVGGMASVAASAPIAPDDNPAAGASVLTSESGAGTHVFFDIDTAANVFSAGAPTIPAPAALPNVPSPTPTPPPLPLPNLPISTPPSPGAASDSPPPPPPPAPAPVNALVGAATTSGVQTDKAGMPWDARIHASTKATIADGTWKKRRGVDAHVVSSVEQQLRVAMAVPAPAAAPAWPFPADSSSVTGAPTFASLMQYLTPRISAGTLTQAHVTAAVQSVGLESLNLVMARIDLIPGILAALREVAP